MAEMRRVQLHPATAAGTGSKGHEIVTSTFYYENRRYTLSGSTPLSVPLEVASAWKSSDSNVVIMPE